ncbi:hypothetical protein [Marinifilum sp. D714]|nr:hypothetical protein [Marinifilum sp. D714]MDQ2178407.1 hypothetical protein [Marinifilum sp. D714]
MKKIIGQVLFFSEKDKMASENRFSKAKKRLLEFRKSCLEKWLELAEV